MAIDMRRWLSWIERVATDHKVGGSNPSRRAIWYTGAPCTFNMWRYSSVG